MPPAITAANLAAAKNGTNLPGSFNVTHPNVAAAAPAQAAAAPASAPAPAAAAPTGGGSSGVSAADAATAAALAKAQANFQNTQAGDMSTINTAVGAGGNDYDQYISDAFNGTGGFGSQQNTINSDAVQNELSRDQGLQGVRDMVNNGINGAGVVLDNAGSGTSSAADAVARAYGVQGRQQASSVGNQYEQGNNTIATNQGNLDTAIGNFQNKDAPTKKSDTINTIVSNAQYMLNNLNSLAQTASITDLPSLQQQIAQVKAQATAALSAYDGELANDVAANAPTSQDANQAKAQGLFQAGVAPANEFNYTATAPATLQGTGPSASSLPIFLGSSNKNNNSSVPVTA